MNKEFLQKLSKAYINSLKCDKFGKREATPKEVADKLHQINSNDFVELESQYTPSKDDVVVKGD